MEVDANSSLVAPYLHPLREQLAKVGKEGIFVRYLIENTNHTYRQLLV
jgi:hypothetical protein